MKNNKPRSDKNYLKMCNMVRPDGKCINYYDYGGSELCWDDFGTIKPIQPRYTLYDLFGKLKCKGNRFLCLKSKYKWFASLGLKEKKKIEES